MNFAALSSSAMEIIILPYMAVSFAIAWAIFAPFAALTNLRQWSFSPIQTSDLLATFVPLSLLLALGAWVDPPAELRAFVWLATIALVVAFAGGGLLGGLYLLAKMESQSVLARMVLIGLVIPLGALLTMAWISIPLVAYAHSMFLAIPATLAIVPMTYGLRALSCWIC